MNIETYLICCRSYFPNCRFESIYDAVSVTFRSNKLGTVPLTIYCTSNGTVYANWTNDLYPITYDMESLLDRLKHLKCNGWNSR